MEAKIIDGKAISNRIRESIKQKVEELKNKGGPTPELDVILVGDDPASEVYVRHKEKAFRQAGMNSNVIRMDADTHQDAVLEQIERLNNDKNVHGILVQLPLPPQIDPRLIINAIDPKKDVDGFHPVNAGRLMTGQDCLEPCTPKGIIRLIQETGEQIYGKYAVVIGRSNIVGKPISLMLLQNDATVTICHSKTSGLEDICRRADILVVAIGKPNFVDNRFVKDGAIVIDVGINRVNNKLIGDVNFQEVKQKAGWITPVPGGVGPMTITMLLENTLQAAMRNE